MFPACQRHAAHLAVVDLDVGDLALEAELAAERFNAVAHVLDHFHQPECADMRLADIHDFRRRSRLYEFGQYLAAVMLRILDLGMQLAVGKSAGAAFAELYVRFRIELALAPEAECVLGALAHFLAAFKHNRPEPALRQYQSSEQAARAAPDHDRTQGGGRRSMRDEAVFCIWSEFHMGMVLQALQHSRIVRRGDVERIAKDDGALLARIVVASKDRVADKFAGRYAQPLDNRILEVVFAVLQGEPYFCKSQHSRQFLISRHENRGCGNAKQQLAAILL